MCLLMGERGMLAVCRVEGVPAKTKCFPNCIKNAALKRLWGRRLCEKDTEVRERKEYRLHSGSCFIIAPGSDV